jgi:hypothetical protein
MNMLLTSLPGLRPIGTKVTKHEAREELLQTAEQKLQQVTDRLGVPPVLGPVFMAVLLDLPEVRDSLGPRLQATKKLTDELILRSLPEVDSMINSLLS